MSSKSPPSDEVFVNLLRVAREDERIGKFLQAIVNLSEFERKSLVNTFLSEMALKGAPSEFVQAIAALRDPQIISVLKQWLQSNDLQA
jgi:hypothetical protein